MTGAVTAAGPTVGTIAPRATTLADSLSIGVVTTRLLLAALLELPAPVPDLAP